MTFWEQYPDLIGYLTLNPKDLPLTKDGRNFIATWLRKMAEDVEHGEIESVLTARRPEEWPRSQPRKVRKGGV